MATTNYLVLLLLALIAGTVLETGMEQQKQKGDVGPDPRRPRPPPPASPRPTPPPSPQPPQPPPAPPAGTHVVVTSTQSVGIRQEYVPDVDPGNPRPGISGTGARNVASSSSSSSSSPVSVGVFDRNPEGELQCQHKRYLHVTDQDNVATKHMKVKDESQKATESQDKNRRPPVQGSAVEHNGFDWEGLVGVLLASKRERDGLEPTFNVESDDATASTIPETKDYQNAQRSDDEVVPEKDSGDDDTAEDSETDDSSCIYIYARGKAYRRLKNLHVVALLREGGEREEKCQNTGSSRAPPDAPAQSAHSDIPPPLFAEFRQLPPVHSFDLQSDHIHLKAVTDQPNCPSTSVRREYICKLDCSASRHPGGSACQGRAPQRAVSLPTGTEQQLSGRLPQQQRELPYTALATGSVVQVPSQTPGASTSSHSPLGVAGGNRNGQSDAPSAVTGKPCIKVDNIKLQPRTRPGVQPEDKWWNTGSFATASSAGAAQWPQLVILSPPLSAGKAAGTILSRSGIQRAGAQRAGPFTLKATTAQQNCAAMSDPTQRIVSPSSATFKDPGVSVYQSRAFQRDVILSRGGEQQLCGHLPQQQRETSNVPSTAAPFGRGAASHLAPQTRRAFAAAPPPLAVICDNRSPQSDTASANLQQPEPRAGRREAHLQQNSALCPMTLATVLEIECTFTFSPSDTTGPVGYDVSQQPAAGRPTSQNPPPENPTATTLPGRQPVSACTRIPGNSRNQNGGNSNNQQGTAVQANNGLLLTGIGSRALRHQIRCPLLSNGAGVDLRKTTSVVVRQTPAAAKMHTQTSRGSRDAGTCRTRLLSLQFCVLWCEMLPARALFQGRIMCYLNL